jgi:hypothetical protein
MEPKRNLMITVLVYKRLVKESEDVLIKCDEMNWTAIDEADEKADQQEIQGYIKGHEEAGRYCFIKTDFI